MAFSSSADAKRAKWFSRRHETADANRDARQAYQDQHGRKARQRKAQERANA